MTNPFQYRTWKTKATLVIVSILISLSLFEITGRMFLLSQMKKMPVDFKSLHGELLHKYDPKLGWVLSEDVHLSEPYIITTNSIGLRNKEIGEKDSLRVLAVGDSRTFGDGVDDEQTWVVKLQKNLDTIQSGRFEVINAGVCGWNAIQGMKYLEDRGLSLKPDMVIFSFGVNEWSNTAPGEVGWVDWEDLQSLWGVEALFRFAVKGCASMLSEPVFGPRRFRVSPGEYTDAISRCKYLCQQAEIKFVVLYIPAQPEIEDSQEDYLAVKNLNQGIAKFSHSFFWDSTECFSPPAQEYFVDTVHLSPLGGDLLAGYLSKKILEVFP